MIQTGIAFKQQISIRQTGIGQREILINRHRLLEEVQCTFKRLGCALVPVVTPEQVEIVCTNIGGWCLRNGHFLATAEFRLQRPDNFPGNVVLDLENVIHFPIKGAGPQVEAIIDADQLGCNPHPVTGLAHTALEYGINVQFSADTADVSVGPFESERRSPGGYTQSVDAGERIQKLLRHALAEVLGVAELREVNKRQYGDGPKFGC